MGHFFEVAATDGFGTGTDSPDVRLVYIEGCTRSVADLCQRIVRVRRDRSAGRAAVFFHPSHAIRGYVADPVARQRMMEFVNRARSVEEYRKLRLEKNLEAQVAMSAFRNENRLSAKQFSFAVFARRCYFQLP